MMRLMPLGEEIPELALSLSPCHPLSLSPLSLSLPLSLTLPGKDTTRRQPSMSQEGSSYQKLIMALVLILTLILNF